MMERLNVFQSIFYASFSKKSVVDEFSMLNLQFLGKLDRRLRQAKNRMDVAFGGISVILAGDFYQLPPVE